MSHVDKISSINLSKIVKTQQPIANSSEGIGQNLSLLSYDKIKNTRPYKDIHNLNNTWQNVLNLSVDALHSTKDLNICCWMLEAITHEEHLLGFSAGMEIIQQLLENYPHCYPDNEEDKFIALKWINDNMSSWCGEEEIFPNMKFNTVHKDIYNNKFNKEMVKNIIYDEKYLAKKIMIINNIKHILTKIKNHTYLFKDVLLFLQKIEQFYLNYQQNIRHNQEKNKNHHSHIHKDKELDGEKSPHHVHDKEYIYSHLSELIQEGLEIDKNDLLLFLMHKILLLRKKNSHEIFKIIRENNLNSLIDIS